MSMTQCKEICPEHGIKCSVMKATKEQLEMEEALIGHRSDWRNHIHLCIQEKPLRWHSWKKKKDDF